jgi:hypothetical protein
MRKSTYFQRLGVKAKRIAVKNLRNRGSLDKSGVTNVNLVKAPRGCY